MNAYAVIAVLVAATAVAQMPSFNYVSFDYPAAMNTQARGINAAGEIVGLYTNDPNCFLSAWPPTNGCVTHGFKRINGNFFSIDVPNAISTAAMGVNAYGDIVGFYVNADNSVHGFLKLHSSSTIQTLDYPGTSSSTSTLATVPMGVNKSLTVVGGLYSAATLSFNGGWVWKSSMFSNMNLGSTGCIRCSSVNGIANSGKIVGQALRNGLWVGYLKIGPDEDFFPRTTHSFITGLNNNADIVGWPGAGGSGGFFAPTVEANESSGTGEPVPRFIQIGFPTSMGSTFPFGINYLRTIVGTYEDDNNGWHGFIATPTF